MPHESQKELWEMEQELRDAGWSPRAWFPHSPFWKAPNGKIYPGPAYAWMILQEQRGTQRDPILC